jgi:hypothetical protein
MGVLSDYFRAADAASVVKAMQRNPSGPLIGLEDTGVSGPFDGVEATGVEPYVALGRLIAAIRQVPWDVGIVGDRSVWPTTPAPAFEEQPDEDDPWATGPWVSELDNTTRDTLADVADADFPKLVAEWAQAEELHHQSPEYLRSTAEELVQLARRARDADEQLYCWTCL